MSRDEPAWWQNRNLMEWAKSLIVLPNGQPISYSGRDYLREIAASNAARLVLRAGRQVEKSTTIVVMMLMYALLGRSSLYVSSRQEQVSSFSRDYLDTVVRNSDVLRNVLSHGVSQKDMGNVFNKRYSKARIHLRAAYKDADSLRGLSTDVIFFDEVQDLAEDALQVGEQCISHAQAPRIIIAGTSKSTESLLEQEYQRSNAKQYQISCAECNFKQVPGRDNIHHRGLICANCKQILRGQGEWVSEFPGNHYADGFTISQLLNPGMCPTAIAEKLHTYPSVIFDNEVLGLPNGTTEQPITKDDLRNCSKGYAIPRDKRGIAKEYQRQIVAGVDWGGGGSGSSRTVAAVGVLDERDDFYLISMRSFQKFDGDRDKVVAAVGQYLRPFHPQFIGADEGGVGRFFNSLLNNQITSNLLNVMYCGGDHAVDTKAEPIGKNGNTTQWRWSINKNIFVSQVIQHIHQRKVTLPRLEDLDSLIDDFLAVQLIYGDDGNARYGKPRHRADDAFHALVYAFVAGRLLRQRS